MPFPEQRRGRPDRPVRVEYLTPQAIQCNNRSYLRDKPHPFQTESNFPGNPAFSGVDDIPGTPGDNDAGSRSQIRKDQAFPIILPSEFATPFFSLLRYAFHNETVPDCIGSRKGKGCGAIQGLSLAGCEQQT